MPPREIIAKALGSVIGWARTADLILAALNSAGFRILGPDEIDGPTVERCAKVAETCPDTPFFESRRWYGDLRNSIPAAIRALKGGD